MQSIRTLMAGIIDYAGLFPPAKLPMPQAAANYAQYLEGDHSWMLGRIIVPVSRLSEFERDAAKLLPQIDDEEPWRISALIDGDLNSDIDRIFAFNQLHAEGDAQGGGEEAYGRGSHAQRAAPGAPNAGQPTPSKGAARNGFAVVDTIELKASTAADIDRALNIIPEQLEAFFELPLAGDPRGVVAALSGTGARAKVRTGGVTPDAFPAPDALANFIAACSAADVPFKATAGLHHPVRAEYPLTYEPNCPRGVMFGFLNVFLAAAFVRAARMTPADAAALLSEQNISAFTVDDQGIGWRAYKLDNTRLARVRETFATSFGSCSFTEPVNELLQLKMLRK